MLTDKAKELINEIKKQTTKAQKKEPIVTEPQLPPATLPTDKERWLAPDNLREMADTLEYLTKPESYCWELGEADPDTGGYPQIATGSPHPDWQSWAIEAVKAWFLNCPYPEVWTEVKKLMSQETITKVRAFKEGNTDSLSDNSKDTTPDLVQSYLYLTDNDTLAAEVALRLGSKELGIDTETTGLDPHCHKLRLVQIAAAGYPTLVIDCFKTDIKRIQPLLDGGAILIFHNAKFDIQFLLKAGLNIPQKVFDTQIAYQILNAGKEEVKCSLKHICKELLGEELDKEERLSDWLSDKLSDNQLSYAAKDSEVLLLLRNKLRDDLFKAKLVDVAKIEFDCLLAVAMMELNGILLDSVKWKQNLGRALNEKEELEAQLKPLLGQKTLIDYDINLDSPAQLKLAIKDKLGLDVSGTSVESLKPHAKDHKAIALLLKYRKIQKLISSFGNSLLDKINLITGRLHPSYWQCGSAAGRFSASSPNLQQIPRQGEVRSAFIPAPGNKFVIADYSQIELRIAAEVSGDKTMITAYKENQDLHALTASVILNKPLTEVSKTDRQIAKSANFGLLYGAGVSGFQAYAKNSYDIDLSEAEAKKIRDNFFKKYKGLARWHAKTKANLPQETRTLAGRRRLFPANGISPQQALNSPVQGTGADILKLALARLPKALEGTGALILATVHDEIILECPADSAEEVARILSSEMVAAGEEFLKTIPVEAEASIGDSWADK